MLRRGTVGRTDVGSDVANSSEEVYEGGGKILHSVLLSLESRSMSILPSSVAQVSMLSARQATCRMHESHCVPFKLAVSAAA